MILHMGTATGRPLFFIPYYSIKTQFTALSIDEKFDFCYTPA